MLRGDEPPPLSSVRGGGDCLAQLLRRREIFRIYVAHLGKACVLLGLSTAWKTKDAAAAGRDLAKSWDKTFPPRPALTEGQMAQLLRPNRWGDELALIALITWTSLLRAPSE